MPVLALQHRLGLDRLDCVLLCDAQFARVSHHSGLLEVDPLWRPEGRDGAVLHCQGVILHVTEVRNNQVIEACHVPS